MGSIENKAEKGELIISTISQLQDIENLKAITETPQDTISPINFKTTKKQFKKFVRTNGFSNDERFIRLK